MNPGNLQLTAALSPLAAAHRVDLTRLATMEMAVNDMIDAATARDDAAWERAKARFDALKGAPR